MSISAFRGQFPVAEWTMPSQNPGLGQREREVWILIISFSKSPSLYNASQKTYLLGWSICLSTSSGSFSLTELNCWSIHWDVCFLRALPDPPVAFPLPAAKSCHSDCHHLLKHSWIVPVDVEADAFLPPDRGAGKEWRKSFLREKLCWCREP